jgi:hypothetical protein
LSFSLPVCRPTSAQQLRHSASIEDRLQRYHAQNQQYQQQAKLNASTASQHDKKLEITTVATADVSKAAGSRSAAPTTNFVSGRPDESIYTILIRFPPSKSVSSLPISNKSSSSYCAEHHPAGRGGTHSHSPRHQMHIIDASVAAASVPRRVPSITMLPAATSGVILATSPGDDGRGGGGSGGGGGDEGSRHYPRSLPITRRFEHEAMMTGNCSKGGTAATAAAAAASQSRGGSGTSSSHFVRQSSSTRSTNTSMSCSPADTMGRQQQSKVPPLDTKLVPKQLLRDHGHQQGGEGGPSISVLSTPSANAPGINAYDRVRDE